MNTRKSHCPEGCRGCASVTGLWFLRSALICRLLSITVLVSRRHGNFDLEFLDALRSLKILALSVVEMRLNARLHIAKARPGSLRFAIAHDEHDIVLSQDPDFLCFGPIIWDQLPFASSSSLVQRIFFITRWNSLSIRFFHVAVHVCRSLLQSNRPTQTLDLCLCHLVDILTYML